jgi:hypothetical protein
MLALIVFYSLAQPRLARFSTIAQCVAVFVLYAMLKESARGILMNGVVTTDWDSMLWPGFRGSFLCSLSLV